MDSTFFVFKDCIAVKWNGVLPIEAPAGITDPKTALGFLTHIAPVSKYNEKLKAFLMTFSAQNLIKLKKQFGPIRCTGGQDKVDSLRRQWAWFEGIKKKAVEIKNSPADALPTIDYKVSPLAPYQHQAVTFLTQVPCAPLFADCGTGKTFCALVSTEHHIKTGVVPRGKTLICGKIATFYSGWLADAKKFTDLKVVCLWVPTSHKRKEKIMALLNEEADVYLINHEGVKIYKDALAEKRFEKVIVDESTVLKSFHSLREGAKGGSFGRALFEVSEYANWRVIMSGTPAPNGPQDLWGQFKFLDPQGFLLEPKFSDFRENYMREVVFGNEDNETAPRTWYMKEQSLPVISDIVTPLSFRVRIRDHILDLPERTIVTRNLSMNCVQEKHYEELALQFYTIVKYETITVSIALALFSRFRQITGGFLYDLEQAPIPLNEEGNPKLHELDSLLIDEIDHEEKVVIFAQYNYEINLLLERYKQFKPVSVFGGNSSANNMNNIDAFINDPSVRLIILHPKSAAHGITLTVAHYMVFYSISFSAEEDYQSVKRIERAGQKNAMFVYYLLCIESIDGYMFETIQAKHARQSQLIDRETDDDTTVTMAQEFKTRLERKYPNIKEKAKKYVATNNQSGRVKNGSEWETSSLS